MKKKFDQPDTLPRSPRTRYFWPTASAIRRSRHRYMALPRQRARVGEENTTLIPPNRSFFRVGPLVPKHLLARLLLRVLFSRYTPVWKSRPTQGPSHGYLGVSREVAQAFFAWPPLASHWASDEQGKRDKQRREKRQRQNGNRRMINLLRSTSKTALTPSLHTKPGAFLPTTPLRQNVKEGLFRAFQRKPRHGRSLRTRSNSRTIFSRASIFPPCLS
jgi:hypothetical protein